MQKIPAVVAMQFQILDTASNRFSKIFYMLLAGGTAIDEAVADARREIYKTAEDQDCLDWAAPILYISLSNVFSFKTDQQERLPQQKRLEEEKRERERFEEEKKRFEEEKRERERFEEEKKRFEEEKRERERLEEEKKRLEEEKRERERLEQKRREQSEEPRITPNNAVAWYNKGNDLLKHERYQEALEAYEQAVRLDPNYVAAYKQVVRLSIRRTR
jgi:tetratricopeptide (TPR) repeat protein